MSPADVIERRSPDAAPAEQVASRTVPRGLIAVLKGAGGFVCAALLWELLRVLNILPPAYVPSIADIARAFGEGFANGTWARVLAPTLFAWLGGLLAAIVLGVVWGSVAGASSWVRAGSSVVISFLRTVPAIALVPVAVLAFGLRPAMVLSLVVFGCVWPVLFNTLYAFRELPEQYAETARVLGYNRLHIFFRVSMVAVLPGVVTGIRVAAGIGLVITVSTELIVGSAGLGGFILQSRGSAQVAAGYAGIVWGGLLGVAVTGLIGVIQHRALGWSPDNRKVES